MEYTVKEILPRMIVVLFKMFLFQLISSPRFFKITSGFVEEKDGRAELMVDNLNQRSGSAEN